MKQMITQEDCMGCGAACVAFAVNVSYEQAAIVLGQDKARTVGFQLREIVEALEWYGLNYHFRLVRSKIKRSMYQEAR
jgi:hypothetical protein